jgi:hypothetical protein
MMPCMTQEILILSVEREAGYGLMLTFSDGTRSTYVVEELLELRPYREQVNKAAKTKEQKRSRSEPL